MVAPTGAGEVERFDASLSPPPAVIPGASRYLVHTSFLPTHRSGRLPLAFIGHDLPVVRHVYDRIVVMGPGAAAQSRRVQCQCHALPHTDAQGDQRVFCARFVKSARRCRSDACA